MKLDPLLSKAARLARKRDYEGALRFLKSEEDRYHGSFKFYYLCGVISLYSGSFLDAKLNFESAKKLKMKDPDTLLGLAFLYLRGMGTRGTNTNQAVDYYLDVLEIDPKNIIAKRALSVIRKHSSSEALSDWLTSGKLSKLFPKIPSPSITPKTVFSLSAAAAAVLVLIFVLLVNLRVLPSPFRNRNARPTADFVLSGQERSQPIETGGSYMYILTRNQATELYDRALSLFSSYRDEAAKINLNRILESNASEGLKNRARLLISNMEVPGFDTFVRSDNPSYAEVIAEPVVYRDVHIIWRGMATNVEITDEYTRFDFLIGYDTRRALEGIVPVIFERPVAINTERPLEVLARIVLTPSYTDITLEGVAIHQSGRLENN